MNTEIEVKFLNIEFDDIRTRLQAIGAQCEQPMRLMRRAIFATPGMDEQRNAFIRVRDEGHRTTVTYKQFDEISLTGAKEVEVQVSDFESMLAILAKTDMRQRAYQESRRETWQIGDVEVVLDEWPWLQPFIEIEGASEERVREVAGQLGFAWEDAVFGAVTQAYEAQYPNTQAADIIMTPEIKFELPLPDILREEVTA
jgi:adenylate cyclase class 2